MTPVLAFLVAGLVAPLAPVPTHDPGVFLVQDSGRLRLLGSDGTVRKEFPERATDGSLAPNGWWVAYYETVVQEPFRDLPPGFVVVRLLADEPPHKLPPAFGHWGFDWRFVWSRDRRRLLIAETPHPNVHAAVPPGRSYRVYDLESKKLTDVRLNTPNPAETWVTDWSADGKRLLGQVGMRLAWLAFDGKSPPEFITLESETAYGGRLSPDGTRVLYTSRVVGTKYKFADYQLFVRDFRTLDRTRITPDNGITDGYCWGPDGKRIAYTLREEFEKPPDVNEYPTRLFTDDAAGGDRRLITTRTKKDWAAMPHFLVKDWR